MELHSNLWVKWNNITRLENIYCCLEKLYVHPLYEVVCKGLNKRDYLVEAHLPKVTAHFAIPVYVTLTPTVDLN